MASTRGTQLVLRCKVDKEHKKLKILQTRNFVINHFLNFKIAITITKFNHKVLTANSHLQRLIEKFDVTLTISSYLKSKRMLNKKHFLRQYRHCSLHLDKSSIVLFTSVFCFEKVQLVTKVLFKTFAFTSNYRATF